MRTIESPSSSRTIPCSEAVMLSDNAGANMAYSDSYDLSPPGCCYRYRHRHRLFPVSRSERIHGERRGIGNGKQKVTYIITTNSISIIPWSGEKVRGYIGLLGYECCCCCCCCCPILRSFYRSPVAYHSLTDCSTMYIAAVDTIQPVLYMQLM